MSFFVVSRGYTSKYLPYSAHLFFLSGPCSHRLHTTAQLPWYPAPARWGTEGMGHGTPSALPRGVVRSARRCIRRITAGCTHLRFRTSRKAFRKETRLRSTRFTGVDSVDSRVF